MTHIQTILHPTDFSQQADYAFQLAGSLARDYSARLIILHVSALPTIVYGEGLIPPNPEWELQEAKEHLKRLEIPGANVRIERQLVEGDPATEILRVSRESGADLIVMGTHGRTGLGRLLMGSIAEQVMRKASCPVLTVKTPLTASLLLGEPVGTTTAVEVG